MAGSPNVLSLADARRPASQRREGEDERALVQALRNGAPWAERALFESYTPHVERILSRILGMHADLDDLVQEVFLRAFQRIEELREPRALRSWLTSIAVFVARETIRTRRRRRWLFFLGADEPLEIAGPSPSPEALAALRAFYEVVATLDPDARIAFTLRFVEGMELAEIAEVCGVSLATIKRRIKGAELEFVAKGRAREALVQWFEEGTRWPQPEE
jgi:RNA polymerase sigma-70 factor (ECF subfamily)